jgi:hypothetical protein
MKRPWGSVIGQGTLLDGNCRVDSPIGVGAFVPHGKDSVSVSWNFDEQCKAVITKIRPITDFENVPPDQGKIEEEGIRTGETKAQPLLITFQKDLGYLFGRLLDRVANNVLRPLGILPGIASADVASTHNHKMTILYTIDEQFGVRATQTYSDLAYTQNGSTISNGRDPSGWCYASAFPNWTINSCLANYTSSAPVKK